MTGLILALPSKGRLQEQALAFFERSGLGIHQARGVRDYFGVIEGLPGTEVQFRAASEIAREVGAGNMHLAVTGLDLLHETLGPAQEELPPGAALDLSAPAPAHLVAKLGFGHANLVVAAPQAWLDVQTMADLADVAARFRLKHHRPIRVATKYVSLTRRYLTGHGVYDYLIVESPGATEGAPAAGTADIIVDITSTGRTLAENGLKIVDDGVMMRSEAVLVASLAAAWSSQAKAVARLMLTRIAADAKARRFKRIEAAMRPSPSLMAKAVQRFGATDAFSGDDQVRLICPAKAAHACSTWLIDEGAASVSVATMEYFFEAANPLFEALEAALSASPFNGAA